MSVQIPARDRDTPELVELAWLALPLVLTNLGNMLLSLVDVAIIGRLGAVEIAAAGLGNAIFFLFAIFGMGLLFGLDPLIAQALGAGERREARRLLWQGMWISGLVTVPLTLGVLAISTQLHRFGVEPAVEDATRTYLYARLPSLLPFLALMGVRSYLQAHGHGLVLFVAVVIANLANVPVALALSFGAPSIGIPVLGIAGAGLATAIATAIQLAVACVPLRWIAVPGGARPLRALDGALAARVWSIGRAIGAQFVIEAGSFSIVTFLVGRLGTHTLGGHQVALTLVSVTFQLALGIGAATSVRVGRAIGRGDPEATRRAGIVGIAAGGTAMILGAMVLFARPDRLASLLAADPQVIAAAAPLIVVAACFQISDGVQTIAQGALRGAGDTRWPLVINLIGHYALGLPIGIALARHLGARGLWWGLALGLSVVAIAMTVRFVRLSRHAIHRV